MADLSEITAVQSCEGCGTTENVATSEELCVTLCGACYGDRADAQTALTDAGVRFLSWADVCGSVPSEPPWVVHGYIAQGAVTCIAGKPKAGKSTFALAIAEAVDADVGAFLGREVCGGPVVYLSEEGAGTLAPKLPGSRRSTALTRDGAWPKPAWSTLIGAAVAEASLIGAKLLVIDALSFWAGFTEGQEKDAGAAQATMDALGEATRADLGVLLIHHQRKAGGQDGDAVRGSGAIFGAVDVLVELERMGEDARPGQRRLVAIGRWPTTTTPSVLVIDRSPAGFWRTVGEAESREGAAAIGYRERLLEIVPEVEPGQSETELAAAIDVDRRKVAAPLRELLAEGLLMKDGGGVRGNPFRYRKSCPEKLPRKLPRPGAETQAEILPPPKGGSISICSQAFRPRGRMGRNRETAPRRSAPPSTTTRKSGEPQRGSGRRRGSDRGPVQRPGRR